MARTQKKPGEKMDYRRTIAFTASQDTMLCDIKEQYGISCSKLVDAAIADYVKRHLGLQWPKGERISL